MGQLGPKKGQNEVLSHFIVQNALVFSPKMGHLGPKRVQNEVLGLFLALNTLDFANAAYFG